MRRYELYREYCNRKINSNFTKMFVIDENDWLTYEKEKTYYTEERFLPRVLVNFGIYPSINEIRRNKPNLMITLDKTDFIDDLKVNKKHRLWILIGEE